MDQKDNLLGVVQTLFRWKKQILLTVAAAALGSIVISLFLPNYYASVTSFYATSADQAKPAPVGPPLKERAYYGEDEEIDRLLAIAESGELVDYITRSFQLFAHYDMDSTNAKAAHRLRLKFLKRYNVKKTKYESIELSMEDRDKQMAADMANAARRKIDEIAQRLIKENQKVQLNTYESNITEKEQDIRMMGDSLSRVRNRYGIYNTESQGDMLSGLLSKAKAKFARNKAKLTALEGMSGIRRDSVLFLRAEINGAKEEIASIQGEVNLFSQGHAQVKALEDILEEAGDQISLDRETYKQIKVVYERGFPALITLEKAEPAAVKSRPIRSLIVIATVLIAFILSVVGVLLLEAYQDINWKEITHGKS